MLWSAFYTALCVALSFSAGYRQALREREGGRDCTWGGGGGGKCGRERNERDRSLFFSLSIARCHFLTFNRACKLRWRRWASWNVSLLTGDKNTKYTFELTNPLSHSCPDSAFLRQCFSGLLYLSRRLA